MTEESFEGTALLLKGEKKILENGFLKPSMHLEDCSSPFWIWEVTAASLYRPLLPHQSPCFYNWHTSASFFLLLFLFIFLISFWFSCSRASQFQTVLSVSFWSSAFHKWALCFAGDGAQVYWTMQLPLCSFTLNIFCVVSHFGGLMNRLYRIKA